MLKASKDPRVVEACFVRLRQGTQYEGTIWPLQAAEAAEAGALEAVANGMRKNAGVVAIQKLGCELLSTICLDIDAGAGARRQRAVEAGALKAVVGGMCVHADVGTLQELGFYALFNLCQGDDAAGNARRQLAADAGALKAVTGGMLLHAEVVGLQAFGRDMLKLLAKKSKVLLGDKKEGGDRRQFVLVPGRKRLMKLKQPIGHKEAAGLSIDGLSIDGLSIDAAAA